MKISAIVAMSLNRAIGKENSLPWKIPSDLKRFREITMGHPIMMGRKTFESIGRILPGRPHFIFSRQSGLVVPGAEVVASLDEGVRLASQRGFQEVFIIGGAEIYRQTLSQVNRLYLTLVHQQVEGDAYFPEFDWACFRTVSREDHFEVIPYSFIVLDRL